MSSSDVMYIDRLYTILCTILHAYTDCSILCKTIEGMLRKYTLARKYIHKIPYNHHITIAQSYEAEYDSKIVL